MHAPPPDADAPADTQHPPGWRGLNVRILTLTILFVLVAEALIYVPSAARFRLTWLEERVASAYLAVLLAEQVPDFVISDDVRRDLLTAAGASAITVWNEGEVVVNLTTDADMMAAQTYDIRDAPPLALTVDMLMLLMGARDEPIAVIGTAPLPGVEVRVLLPEAPMREALLSFSANLLILGLIVSLTTAGLLFLALRRILIAPIVTLTTDMTRFRAAPEDARAVIAPSDRKDEIGRAEREMAILQNELRAALRQRERLAALGTGVTRISHDLRNILATAQLIGDRLVESADPEVRQIAPRVVQSIGRALRLCTDTLSYGRAREAPPQLEPIRLVGLVEDVAAALATRDPSVPVTVEVPTGLVVTADREQLFRALMNLVWNAAEAWRGMTEEIKAERAENALVVTAVQEDGAVVVTVADRGPGVPPKVQANLFRPFVASGRAGGSGLGMAIARDLVRGLGGDVSLVETGEAGTVFAVRLPDYDA